MRISDSVAIEVGSALRGAPGERGRGFQALLDAATERPEAAPGRPEEPEGSAPLRLEILEKGLFELVQERQLAALRDEIRDQVLGGLGLGAADLAAMPEAQRREIEQSIEDEVARRLRERFMLAVEEELAEQQEPTTADRRD